jgi:uncharacterized protein YdhG (YjbR/CyaY superfamily)
MVSSKAATVDEYLAELPEERREAIATVRRFILDHLPEGYVEGMNWGMIVYEIPLERYPDTYNNQPLGLVALASQKNHMSLYLLGDDEFRRRWKETGKKLDMGKTCIRFRRVDDLALDVIGDTLSATPVDRLIAIYEAARQTTRKR